MKMTTRKVKKILVEIQANHLRQRTSNTISFVSHICSGFASLASVELSRKNGCWDRSIVGIMDVEDDILLDIVEFFQELLSSQRFTGSRQGMWSLLYAIFFHPSNKPSSTVATLIKRRPKTALDRPVDQPIIFTLVVIGDECLLGWRTSIILLQEWEIRRREKDEAIQYRHQCDITLHKGGTGPLQE
jgi:hypothetical protein